MHGDTEQDEILQDHSAHRQGEEQTECRRVVEPAQIGGVPGSDGGGGGQVRSGQVRSGQVTAVLQTYVPIRWHSEQLELIPEGYGAQVKSGVQ